MKDKNYKNAWQELKEEIINQYIVLTNTEEGPDNIETLPGRINELERIGLYMDELDTTQEFNNVLIDIDRKDR